MPQMSINLQMNIHLQMNLYLDRVDNTEGARPFLPSTRYDGLDHYDGKMSKVVRLIRLKWQPLSQNL